MEKKTNGLAVASLVLAIIALLLFWIPVANIAAIIVGIIGLVLGLCGLTQPKKTLTIVASVLCFVAIIGSILINHATAKGITSALGLAAHESAAEMTVDDISIDARII